MYCSKCGTQVNEEANFCHKCGTRLSNKSTSTGGDKVGGDKISLGDLHEVKGIAVGKGAQAAQVEEGGKSYQAQRDIILGDSSESQRAEQYRMVSNWNKKKQLRGRGFDLSNQDLSELELPNADLRGANLEGADLNSTDLNGANLSEANLIFADLNGANLSGANLSEANLGWVKHDEKTIWPDKFTLQETKPETTPDGGGFSAWGGCLFTLIAIVAIVWYFVF